MENIYDVDDYTCFGVYYGEQPPKAIINDIKKTVRYLKSAVKLMPSYTEEISYE